jgi:hypothetical protein
MGYKVIYLVKTYNIPLTLVINSDETRIRLVPTPWERTWESKGIKHIQSFKDKG